MPEYGLEELEDADLVALPAAAIRDEYPPAHPGRAAAGRRRGAILLTVCSGAFVLGAAGLLDGRACTTHWAHVDELAERFPLARLDPDVLFVDDGNIITSAGTAAGIDACLHLVRRELGSAVATPIARRMVVPPQRDGGQRQYVELPMPELRGGEPAAGARLDGRQPAHRAHRGRRWPGGPRCPSAPSPAGSSPRPGRRRTGG